MNKKQYYLLASVLVLVVLTGFGCTKTATEKSLEKSVENATNGTADVDIKNNSVTINTNGSSWQTGEQVSLPSGFPTDVYVVDGTIKSAVTTVAGQAYILSIQTTKTVSEVKSLYETELVADGWTITANATIEGSASLLADKGNRSVTVGISPNTDGTTVVGVTTMQKAS